MADAVLSVALKRLAAIAEENIRGEVSLLRGVKEEVVKLSAKLQTVRNVLEDAERRGVKEKSVRGWLKKLEDMVYEMDDILDEWNYYAIDASLKQEIEKEKVRCSFIPSSCLCFNKVGVRRDIAKKIQNVKASLDEILKEKDEFNFVTSVVPTTDSAPRFETTSSIDVEKVEGQDVEKNKNDIVGKLMIEGDTQQIVCIVGMGGIGKTTLAQLVCNDSRVKNCFGKPIWVCVSDPFDVAGIARGIIDIVGSESPPNTNRLEVILEKLRNSISGKKFLLVLDDVWTEDYNEWEPLKINLKHGGAGSKILVTTRKEGVAKMMGTFDDEIYHPKLLTDEECWSLLRRTSFRGKEERGEFEEVGKKIASKCKGLPLAVNILGSVLHSKNSLEDWENILESEIWELDEAEVDLYPHLLLSYKELSPPLQLCFSYCAAYPKDTRIKVESLIQHWMALGYLGSVTGNPRAEREVRDCFNNLAMRSLFQDFEKDDSHEQITSCKMHDIVHDFAQYLRKVDRVEASGMTKRACKVCNNLLVSHVQKYRSLLYHQESPPSFCDCLRSLRVLGNDHRGLSNGRKYCIPPGVEKLIHLRLLDLSGTRLSKKEMKIICKLYYLQTLSLQSCCLEEIPHEIGNLVRLRHLTLSYNGAVKELPDNMFNLIELRTLLLHGCSLKEISWKIENLIELRYLDLSWNKELVELPENITKLIRLHTLLLEWCSLKEIPCEIGNLVKLRHLDLSWNEGLKELPKSMYKLVELQSMTLENSQNCKLPEGLANLNGIHSLEWFYGGSGFNRFGLLKNLNSLSGLLRLFISVSSSTIKGLVDDAREAELKKKIHLRRLDIEFKNERNDQRECSSSSSPSLLVDLIEALEPNQNLQRLNISHYQGSRLPWWISSPLNLVREISLSGCSKLSSLPPMGKLPLLENLSISGMREWKVLGVEWLGIRGREREVVMDIQSSSSLVAFPKLKEFYVQFCDEWLEWEDITADEEESSAVSVMPCLTRLSLYGCEGLNMLPHRLLRKASSLQELSIHSSSKLTQRYGDNDGSPWRSISRNNPQLQLITGSY